MDNRPLSPHLQVYRLPLLALLSITHRMTGVFLSAVAILLPVYLATIAFWPQYFDCIQAMLGAWYGQIFLFAVSASLMFHLLNGIRHFFWDAGLNLEVQSAERSGYAVIVLSIILTAVIWFIACSNLYGGGQ